MANAWQEYQEEAAAFFRLLGLEANVDATVKGVRTSHDIDVLVKSRHAGFEVTWLVECKHWKSPVSKLHVLGLREIVADVGADRGILLCEAGFQSGAIEAASLTNVQITSLEHLRVTTGNDVSAMRLRELYDRVESARVRYWEIPKSVRIAHGLRSDLIFVDETFYSGARVVELCQDLLARAFRAVYPFESDSVEAFSRFGRGKQFQTATEVVAVVEPLVQELEGKLNAAESARDSWRSIELRDGHP